MDRIIPLYMTNQLSLDQTIQAAEPFSRNVILLASLQTSKSLPLVAATESTAPPDLPSPSQERLLILLRHLLRRTGSVAPPSTPLIDLSTPLSSPSTSLSPRVSPSINHSPNSNPFSPFSSSPQDRNNPRAKQRIITTESESESDPATLSTEITSSTPNYSTTVTQGTIKPYYNLIAFVAFLTRERLVRGGEDIAIHVIRCGLEGWYSTTATPSPSSPSKPTSITVSTPISDNNHENENDGRGRAHGRTSSDDLQAETNSQTQRRRRRFTTSSAIPPDIRTDDNNHSHLDPESTSPTPTSNRKQQRQRRTSLSQSLSSHLHAHIPPLFHLRSTRSRSRDHSRSHSRSHSQTETEKEATTSYMGSLSREKSSIAGAGAGAGAGQQQQQQTESRLAVSVTAAALWLIIMGEELWERCGSEEVKADQTKSKSSFSSCGGAGGAGGESGSGSPSSGPGSISRSQWRTWLNRLQFLSLREDLGITTRELASEAAAVMRRV